VSSFAYRNSQIAPPPPNLESSPELSSIHVAVRRRSLPSTPLHRVYPPLSLVEGNPPFRSSRFLRSSACVLFARPAPFRAEFRGASPPLQHPLSAKSLLNSPEHFAIFQPKVDTKGVSMPSNFVLRRAVSVADRTALPRPLLRFSPSGDLRQNEASVTPPPFNRCRPPKLYPA